MPDAQLAAPRSDGTDTQSTLLIQTSTELAAQATTAQLEELRMLQLTIEELEQRRKLGVSAQKAVRPFFYDALDAIGHKLKDLNLSWGVRLAGRNSLGGTIVLLPKNAVTLSDLSITKRLSSQAQLYTDFPSELREKVRNGKLSFRQAKHKYLSEMPKTAPLKNHEDDLHIQERRQQAIEDTNVAISNLSAHLKRLLGLLGSTCQNKKQIEQTRKGLIVLRVRLDKLTKHVDTALLHLDNPVVSHPTKRAT